MNAPPLFSRRDILKLGSIAALAAPVLGRSAPASEAPSALPAGEKRRSPLGVATFSLTKLPVPGVIAALNTLAITRASLYHSHAPWADGTPEACRAVVQQFKDSGIAVTSTGVIEFSTDEAAARKAFENVKGAGVAKICARPEIAALPLLDRLVKEYDLTIAIHNHGPTDLYPTADDVWKHIGAFDPRIGICIDVGHAWRAGGDPAAEIRQVKDRLYEVHLKDTKGPRGTATRDPAPVVVGRGAIDIHAILTALAEVGYSHETEFEYEVRADDKMPGLAESVGYVRGMLAGMPA